MRPHRQLIFCALMLSALSACAEKPENFAHQMQSALDSGDVDAALALGSLDRAPPDLLFFFTDMVGDCGFEQSCTVSLGSYDEKAAEDAAAQAAEGFAYEATPDGMLTIVMKPREGTEFGSSGKASVPYGRLNGKYRMLGGAYTPEKLAALRATSTESQVDAMLADGIYDRQTQERRTDWKTAATMLPADGGEAGRWFTENTARLAAAYASGDPEAMIKVGGSREARIFGATDYAGKPVPMAHRKIKVRAQASRAMKSVRVLGGYQLGDDSVLQFEGETMTGWIKRGAVLISREDGEFGLAGWKAVSYQK